MSAGPPLTAQMAQTAGAEPAQPDYAVRPATVADVAVLAAQRRAMFAAMGTLPPQGADPAPGDALEAATRRYLARAMPAGLFHAWVVEYRGSGYPTGAIVAGGGVQLRELLPLPGWRSVDQGAGEPPDCATEALVLSMWCDEAHRRRGLATRVMEAVLAFCRERGVFRISLHAAPMGRTLYERLGFVPTNEMRLVLGFASSHRSG